MKSLRTLSAALLAAATLAAQAQVGTYGEVGGMPYGTQGVANRGAAAQGTAAIGTAAMGAGSQRARPAWATSNPWSTSYNPLVGFQSTKTREAVRAELLAGRQALLASEGLPPRRAH